MEFLVEKRTLLPDAVAPREAAKLVAAEAARIAQLAEAGRLRRLWRASDGGRQITIGLWNARDEDELHRLLGSLPLHDWMTVRVVPLSAHPNDPVRLRNETGTG